MGLFKLKPNVTIEDCCRDFYDSRIFKSKTIDASDLAFANKKLLAKADDPSFDGSDLSETEFAQIATAIPWSDYLALTLKWIAEVDPSLSAIDRTRFWDEMTALYMEVFALALTIRTKLKLEDMVREVFFTKHYLEHNQRVDLWDAMLEYNDVIDHSAFMNDDGQSAELDSAWHRGRFGFLVDLKDADRNSGWARYRVTFMNGYRFSLFKEWIKSNVADPRSRTREEEEKLECLAIALKRVGADMTREDCLAVRLLASSSVKGLGCATHPNGEAMFRLGSLIFGLHRVAKQYLKSVRLQ